MANANFVPMYDLERLDADQKAQYYRDACDFLGIPANLNLLAFIFMNVGDTGRHEVLYAKKGATDFIRDSRGITTVSLEPIKDFVAGQVCFIAAGLQESTNRKEFAVGAASIEGLTGKALSDAIMTAQTRATRRMTLQFVGGGILDESELPEGLVTTPLANVNPEAVRALDAITTQPVVHPNSTPSIVVPSLPAPSSTVTFVPDEKFFTPPVSFPLSEITKPTEAQLAAQAALASVKPETLAKASGENSVLGSPQDRKDFVDAVRQTETFKNIKDLAATLPANSPLAQAAAPTAEAPKQRKRKAAEDMPASPEDVRKNLPMLTDPALQSPSNPAGIKGVSASADIPQSQGSTTLPAQPVEPPKVEKKLKPEEEKEIRARLGKYRNEILPAGKMEPIAEVGGVEVQLRTFVQKFYPDKPSSKTWDYADWAYLLNYFDETVKNSGAEGLVKAMQQKIGVRA